MLILKPGFTVFCAILYSYIYSDKAFGGISLKLYFRNSKSEMGYIYVYDLFFLH